MSQLKIFFGPYEAHGTIRHRPLKFAGLQDYFEEIGCPVEFIPTRFLDVLTVEMMGKQIFRCNIKYLKFNMDLEYDPLAQKIAQVVAECKIAFESEENVPYRKQSQPISLVVDEEVSEAFISRSGDENSRDSTLMKAVADEKNETDFIKKDNELRVFIVQSPSNHKSSHFGCTGAYFV